MVTLGTDNDKRRTSVESAAESKCRADRRSDYFRKIWQGITHEIPGIKSLGTIPGATNRLLNYLYSSTQRVTTVICIAVLGRFAHYPQIPMYDTLCIMTRPVPGDYMTKFDSPSFSFQLSAPAFQLKKVLAHQDGLRSLCTCPSNRLHLHMAVPIQTSEPQQCRRLHGMHCHREKWCAEGACMSHPFRQPWTCDPPILAVTS